MTYPKFYDILACCWVVLGMIEVFLYQCSGKFIWIVSSRVALFDCWCSDSVAA